MKKVIDGKRYDTDSARKMGERSGGQYGDLNWISETLYRKSTGEYFLHGQGGANTRYAVAIGAQSWSGGEKIFPLSLEEAKEWASENLDGDTYEEIFGTGDDDSKKTVTFSLPETVIERIRQKSLEKKMTMSDYVAYVVTKEGK